MTIVQFCFNYPWTSKKAFGVQCNRLCNITYTLTSSLLIFDCLFIMSLPPLCPLYFQLSLAKPLTLKLMLTLTKIGCSSRQYYHLMEGIITTHFNYGDCLVHWIWAPGFSGNCGFKKMPLLSLWCTDTIFYYIFLGNFSLREQSICIHFTMYFHC